MTSCSQRIISKLMSIIHLSTYLFIIYPSIHILNQYLASEIMETYRHGCHVLYYFPTHFHPASTLPPSKIWILNLVFMFCLFVFKVMLWIGYPEITHRLLLHDLQFEINIIILCIFFWFLPSPAIFVRDCCLFIYLWLAHLISYTSLSLHEYPTYDFVFIPWMENWVASTLLLW